MLTPDTRTILTDALRPPAGMHFDRGAALTFTLGLETALVAPLAFARSRSTADDFDPIEMLHAARECADRLDIFCQAGQVGVPQRGVDLLSLLEPMIHPVTPTRAGALFHPKVWFVRFRSDESDDCVFRLLISSRNLSESRSWDTCLRLDGVRGTRRRSENAPMAALLRHSASLAVAPLDPSRISALEELIEDLRRVEWELPEGVQDVQFHALGIPGSKRLGLSGTRALAISPFWSSGGMDTVGDAPDLTIVGRQEELDRLPEEALEGVEAFVINELAGLPSDDEDGHHPAGDALTGLHAKVYVVEYNRRAYVFVGSANATDAAFHGNIEVLAELSGSRTALGIDTMIRDDADFRSILVPYDRQTPVDEDPVDLELADFMRSVAAVPMSAAVLRGATGSDDGERLRLHLTTEESLPRRDGVAVGAELITRPGESIALATGQHVDVTWSDLKVEDVTPFVVLTARDQSGHEARTVVLATLDGDPPDRFDLLLARQIDTPEKFLKLLALLLQLGSDVILAREPEDDNSRRQGKWAMSSSVGVLELLLNAVADGPEQLDSLARLVERLRSTDSGRRVLPEGFLELWDVVDRARRQVGKVGRDGRS